MIGLQEAQNLIQSESTDDSHFRAILSTEGEDFQNLSGEIVRSPSGHAGVLYRSTLADQFLDQRMGIRYAAVAFKSWDKAGWNPMVTSSLIVGKDGSELGWIQSSSLTPYMANRPT